MKKIWGLLTCLCLAACSDIEDLETLVPTSSASRTSASAERDVTSYFDWEASPYIQLLDVPGDVILPWYSGAKGAIPAFITNHYKASEGWELDIIARHAPFAPHPNIIHSTNAIIGKLLLYLCSKPVRIITLQHT